MKQEHIIQAFQNLDKYTLNEVAEQEVNRLRGDGLTIAVPQETLYDRLVNSFDSRRLILERKADILEQYYGDTKFAKDLCLDYINDTHKYNLLKYGAITGLAGYSGYTALFQKTPFLKVPGLLISAAAVHFLTRYLSNNHLEQKLERPWQIHTYRLSKGLGPTNTKANTHSRFYNKINEINETKKEDYLHALNLKPEFLSIYKKENKTLKEKPYSFATTERNLIFPKFKNVENLHKYNQTPFKEIDVTYDEIKDIVEKGSHTAPTAQSAVKAYIKTDNGNRTLHKGQTEEILATYEANHPEEVGDNDVIFFKNEYDNPLSLADGLSFKPEYSRLINIINYDKNFRKKFFYDWEMNLGLKQLKKKVHHLRQLGAPEEDVVKLIDQFNADSKKKLEDFHVSQIKVVNNTADSKSLLIHSDKEANHLREYFNFLNKSKVELLKPEESEDLDLGFEIDENNYDPWEEYKLIYKDLFEKGRKHFIIQSIPDWKFLQVRKPSPLRADPHYDQFGGEKTRMDDSIFQILALERYHHERNTKENRFNQEKQTHRI